MSQWIQNTRANRFNNSYVKGFVDISGGDLLVRSGDVSFNQQLYVNDNITVSGDILPAVGNTYSLGSAERPFGGLYISNNTIHFAGAGADAGALSFSGGGLAVQSAAEEGEEEGEVQQLLAVSDNKVAIGKASSTANGNLDVSGTIIATSDVSFNAGLSLDGTAALKSTLTVTDATTLSSTLNVTKAATLSSTLSVAKAATLSSTLDVTDATTLSSTLDVTKAATLSSTLDVTDATTLSSTLDVTKAATLSSTLSVSGNMGINTTPTTDIALDINTTNAIRLPKGTNANRPVQNDADASYKGLIRYNSEQDQFEGFGAGQAWGSLGGVKDVDQDTYIIAETSAGADNDQLKFYTAGSERLVINAAGDMSLNSDLAIAGNLVMDGTLQVRESQSIINTTINNLSLIHI